jgi:hypothetical protein
LPLLIVWMLTGCVEQGELDLDPGEMVGETEDASGPGPAFTPECHPLDQSFGCSTPGECGECPDGDGCYPAAGATAFACGPGGSGGFGASCVVSTECQRGSLCVATEVDPGCSAGYGCCTWFCEVGEGSCPGGTYCAAFFNQDAPVGFESLGACVPKGA